MFMLYFNRILSRSEIHLMIWNFRAGWRVTTIDTSDPDWWKGRCNGKIGYFPAKYAEKLNPGEQVLQVTQGLEVTEAEGSLKLLKDQVSCKGRKFMRLFKIVFCFQLKLKITVNQQILTCRKI